MRGATTHQCEAYPRIKVIISQFLRVIFCDDACASNVRFNKVRYITLFDKFTTKTPYTTTTKKHHRKDRRQGKTEPP